MFEARGDLDMKPTDGVGLVPWESLSSAALRLSRMRPITLGFSDEAILIWDGLVSVMVVVDIMGCTVKGALHRLRSGDASL